MYLIIYQKWNGQTIFKIVRNYPHFKKIGDLTSMGWRVLDIQVFDKDRFFTNQTYRKILQEDFDMCDKKRRKKEKMKKIFEIIAKILK